MVVEVVEARVDSAGILARVVIAGTQVEQVDRGSVGSAAGRGIRDLVAQVRRDSPVSVERELLVSAGFLDTRGSRERQDIADSAESRAIPASVGHRDIRVLWASRATVGSRV